MIQSLDNMPLAISAGAEDLGRRFYEILGFHDVPKPHALLGRGGFWTVSGAINLHFGVDPNFAPATKALPAFRIVEIDVLVARLEQAGYGVVWDTNLPAVRRCFLNDPVGNRIELIGV